MRAERWEETTRRLLGVTAGWDRHTGGNFTILYMVTEARRVRGKVVEWRERIVHGTTLYQASTGDIGTAAVLEMVAKGVKALSAIARIKEHATSRRKAR